MVRLAGEERALTWRSAADIAMWNGDDDDRGTRYAFDGKTWATRAENSVANREIERMRTKMGVVG